MCMYKMCLYECVILGAYVFIFFIYYPVLLSVLRLLKLYFVLAVSEGEGVLLLANIVTL